MYLSESIGNILQKFNNQPENILYEPRVGVFDLLVSLCEINLFIVPDNPCVINNSESSTCYNFSSEQLNMFNFTGAISNNLLSYTSNQKFLTKHINTAIFVHEYKQQQIKKEDVLLINGHLSRVKKFCFSECVKNTWKNLDLYQINYGICQESFVVENSKENRSEKILIISNQKNNENTRILSQVLTNNNLSNDIIETSELSVGVEQTRTIFNKYKTCVALADVDYINILVAISCGSNVVYQSVIPENQNLLKDVPRLFLATHIEDLIAKIGAVSKINQYVNHQKYFQDKFNFSRFKSSIQTIVKELKTESFII